MHRLTREDKVLYKRHKETIKRSFADAKQLHGHMRGLLRAQEQCLLPAACQNMKKMALLFAKEEKGEDRLYLAVFKARQWAH